MVLCRKSDVSFVQLGTLKKAQASFAQVQPRVDHLGLRGFGFDGVKFCHLWAGETQLWVK